MTKRLGMAKLASATEHATKDDPPVILLYGSEDKSLVKPLHGERLKTRYVQTGLHANYQLIEGAGHGGPQYRDEKRRGLILPMLEKTLRKSFSRDQEIPQIRPRSNSGTPKKLEAFGRKLSL